MGLNRSTLTALLVFAALVIPLPLQAAQFSGAYMMQVCNSDKNGKETVPGGHIACQSYIAGILDYHNLIRSMDVAPSVDFCIPEGTNLYKLQNQVMRYMVKNKEDHDHFIASPGVALALFSSYPCKGQKKKKGE